MHNISPSGWNQTAQDAWKQGKRELALEILIAALNNHGPAKPVRLVLQLAYFLFLIGDYRAAAAFLEATRQHHPQHAELLLNLAVCLTRAKENDRALAILKQLVELDPKNYVAWDALCSNLGDLGQLPEAAEAGTKSLVLKDRSVHAPDGSWALPGGGPAQWTSACKSPVVAFSLWGNDPRYLRGALDNAMAVPVLYPGWTSRFYLDMSVPADVREALSKLGADLLVEHYDAPLRQKLAWRFKVAADPKVGRFLIRDADAVVNEREVAAVTSWIASDRWFHIMRDWWTHSELMLAGMWGGVAGILPPLVDMLERYQPLAVETPNIDQWFLRDCVWAYVRQSCLVHDRFFTPPGASSWPVPAPQGNIHVGQDEFTARRREQAERLGSWAQSATSLQLAG